MAGSLKRKNRRNIDDIDDIDDIANDSEAPALKVLSTNNILSDVEVYAKEVLEVLITDNIPPTPNNFSLYFDRLLEDKSEALRRQIYDMLELEESNETETTIGLENSLKHGFSSIKNILNITANLYKNMSLMTKILEKRKEELIKDPEISEAIGIVGILEGDVSKLNSILKTQSVQLRSSYDATAKIVKSVENTTIFDNKFGVYNKRYLLTKVEQEIEVISKFNHHSSLIMIELSKTLKQNINNQKAITLMTRTISRLLLKTSRRSDIVAHYGNGVFAMLLKHTDIPSAKKASERLCDLVSNSNFFLADREIQLRISIGITDIDTKHSVEEIVVSAMDAIEKAYESEKLDYAVSLRAK